MKQEQSELLNTQNNADGNPNRENSSDELITREQIEGSPFHVIGNQERGYFLAVGRYRVTEVQPTKEDAIVQMEADKWNIIMRIITAVGHSIDEVRNLENK